MKHFDQLFILSNLKTFTKVFLITFQLFLSFHADAQFEDYFSDGDFTNDPSWSGDTGNFLVQNGELRLKAPSQTTISVLSTPFRIDEITSDIHWEFNLRMDFNPSGANFCRIYLMSDQENLGDNAFGYFLMAGSASDDISLYRQEGKQVFKVIDGEDNRLNLSSINAHIKIDRRADGAWVLASDIGHTGTFVNEGSAVDNTLTTSDFFGLSCVYTGTRSDKFYFDDFLVKITPDENPPVVVSVTALSARSVQINFDERIDAASAMSSFNYGLGAGFIHPSAVSVALDRKSVSLEFDQFLVPGAQVLTLRNIQDVYGNILPEIQKTFRYDPPSVLSFRDIVITEIFPQPIQNQSLPQAEYVEIFNRSNQDINLEGWTLSDENSSGIIKSFVIPKAQYTLLTLANLRNRFTGTLPELTRFPSLNNDEDQLVLKNKEGQIIDSLHYHDSWYHDDDKKTGGWALELIDINNICLEEENWSASEDVMGGTPGKPNSIAAEILDHKAPRLLQVIPSAKDSLLILFSEKMQSIVPSASSLNFTPSLKIESVGWVDHTFSTLHVHLAESLEENVKYELTMSNVSDCASNEIDMLYNSVDFSLPQPADSLDVVINEILFNPRPTGIDFIEVFNASNKFINLKNWKLANVESNVLKNPKSLFQSDMLLPPHEFMVFTTSKSLLLSEYVRGKEDKIVERIIPTMPDDQGSIAITNDTGKIIDAFHYDDNMHSPFLKDHEGVSLERIAASGATQDANNWQSASADDGFATPGYVNSNQRQQSTGNTEAVQVVPEIFIPTSSSTAFTQIHYKFDRGGVIGNVRVYDPSGFLIKEIANNHLLGAEGFFRWDGDRTDGSKARTGSYMIWFEVFDELGHTKVFRKPVVIASQF
jgi:hypothetical protein